MSTVLLRSEIDKKEIDVIQYYTIYIRFQIIDSPAENEEF